MMNSVAGRKCGLIPFYFLIKSCILLSISFFFLNTHFVLLSNRKAKISLFPRQQHADISMTTSQSHKACSLSFSLPTLSSWVGPALKQVTVSAHTAHRLHSPSPWWPWQTRQRYSCDKRSSASVFGLFCHWLTLICMSQRWRHHVSGCSTEDSRRLSHGR